MAMIDTQDLTRRFGRLAAVDSLTMSVETGAIFGFIGPNGAGKTTTMRILATLLEPSAGNAWINGYSVVRDAAAVRLQLGYMPDSFGVYPNMKVWEYLDFFAACYRVPPQRRRRLVDDLLALVDLAVKKDAYVETLSRGMKQRLCLARTLVHDPAVLILDEPASGLDPRARVELRELLKELCSMGKTILLSSHILSEMAEICTHVGIVEHGRLLTAGAVDEIMRQIRGHRQVQVRLLGPAAAARHILAGLAGVEDVRATRGERENGSAGEENDPLAAGKEADGATTSSLAFSFKGDEAGLNHVLVRLVAAGVRVYSFTEQASDLEDAFLQLTEGAMG